MGRMGKAISKYLARLSKVRQWLFKRAKMLAAKRMLLEQQWRRSLFLLREGYLQVCATACVLVPRTTARRVRDPPVACTTPCPCPTPHRFQELYAQLGPTAPPLEFAPMSLRVYSRNIEPRRGSQRQLVPPSAASIKSLRRPRFPRRNRRSRAASTLSQESTAPPVTPSRGRRVSRRGAVLINAQDQQRVLWLWLEVQVMK